MDVIVTDHHRPGDELPDCTVVHPALGATRSRAVRRRAWRSSSRGLRSPGAIRGATRTSTWPGWPPCATWCRCAARTGGSCARGSRRWRAPRRPGLRALMRVAALEPGAWTRARAASGWGRGSTPPGGCSRADAALELLLTEDEERARRGRRRARPAQPRPPGDRAAHPARGRAPRARRPAAAPRRSWWRARAGTRASSASWRRGWSSATAARAW